MLFCIQKYFHTLNYQNLFLLVLFYAQTFLTDNFPCVALFNNHFFAAIQKNTLCFIVSISVNSLQKDLSLSQSMNNIVLQKNVNTVEN